MYKIIAYIYQCMKDGKPAVRSHYSTDALGVPEDYWKYVIEQLVSHGYIEGITVTKTFSNTIIIPDDPKVTIEGIQFAKENSVIAKAKKFLIEMKAVIPFV